ncbi:MAG: hypothetical protein H0W25_02555, partial [Acidimicrobiia bacterium]|nr:hypothetical protein [Acidimicrobiia bacterium]
MRRRSSFVLFVLVAALVGSVAPPARADVAVLSLDGRGFGHGVGLSQWGAKYAADAGASVEQILATFYPGTELTTAGGAVRVGLLQAADRQATLQFPQGGEVRSPRSGPQAAGFPVSVPPGGSVVVRFDGAYR